MAYTDAPMPSISVRISLWLTAIVWFFILLFCVTHNYILVTPVIPLGILAPIFLLPGFMTWEKHYHCRRIRYKAALLLSASSFLWSMLLYSCDFLGIASLF